MTEENVALVVGRKITPHQVEKLTHLFGEWDLSRVLLCFTPDEGSKEAAKLFQSKLPPEEGKIRLFVVSHDEALAHRLSDEFGTEVGIFRSGRFWWAEIWQHIDLCVILEESGPVENFAAHYMRQQAWRFGKYVTLTIPEGGSDATEEGSRDLEGGPKEKGPCPEDAGLPVQD